MLIVSLELSKLQKICPDFTNEFFTEMLANIPQGGVNREHYYILNNNLALNNPTNLAVIVIYNNFVAIARRHCNLIQILKNK